MESIMVKINVLDHQTIDQIAAGEVVASAKCNARNEIQARGIPF